MADENKETLAQSVGWGKSLRDCLLVDLPLKAVGAVDDRLKRLVAPFVRLPVDDIHLAFPHENQIQNPPDKSPSTLRLQEPAFDPHVLPRNFLQTDLSALKGKREVGSRKEQARKTGAKTGREHRGFAAIAEIIDGAVTINVPQQAPFETREQIVKVLNPDKIILFGSYAYGNPTEDSDVDLLVIMPFEGKWVDKSVEIQLKIHPYFPIDLLVRTPDRIRERLSIGDSFLREVLQEGRILYETRH